MHRHSGACMGGAHRYGEVADAAHLGGWHLAIWRPTLPDSVLHVEDAQVLAAQRELEAHLGLPSLKDDLHGEP